LTGGGDNLNAGFCLGLLNNLSIEECMLAGMATSGAYVQNGFSPSMDDLIEYLKTYN
jgi:sugar/nucleoside kinase (ribokinase family)